MDIIAPERSCEQHNAHPCPVKLQLPEEPVRRENMRFCARHFFRQLMSQVLQLPATISAATEWRCYHCVSLSD